MVQVRLLAQQPDGEERAESRDRKRIEARRGRPQNLHAPVIEDVPALPAKKTRGMKLTIRPGGLAKARAQFDKNSYACNMAAPIWGAA